MRLSPRLLTSLGLALLGVGWTSLSRADQPFTLALPLACEVGRTCFIQQYADHDPGPGAKDYACGSRTYDGHDGVDIRVPDAAVQRAGVEVRASAAGVIKGARDGMDDIDPRKLAPGALKNRECGNGVVIGHEGGWETQYCHMARGSVRVKPGDRVTSGQALGLVGQSGEAEFPHLHLTVRKDGKWVDPFAYGAPAGSCRPGLSLFNSATSRALAYRSPDVLNIGFAASPPTMDSIEAGQPVVTALGADATALVFYVRLIGLEAGDVQMVSLRGPDGKAIAENRAAPLDRAKAQYFSFVGKRRTAAWLAGAYTGEVSVQRGGKTVLTRKATLTIR